MADVLITARLPVRAIDAGLRGILQRGKLTRPYFTGLRAPLRKDIRQHARRYEGPEGKWQRRTPETLFKRKDRKHASGIVTPLGRLVRAYRVRIDDASIRARSVVPFSGVHQAGGRVGRGVQLPARPFLWASDELLTLAAERWLERVLQPWGRA